MRQEVFDVLDSAGPCSIAELGRRLGRAPDSLYFHVRRLLKVALVVETERHQEGRHVRVLYDVAARPMRIDRSKARAEDMHAVVGGILRLAARDFRRGSRHPDTVVAGAQRNHAGARVRGWVDPHGLARVNELLEELGLMLRSSRPAPGTQPIALAWVLAPVPERGAGGSRTRIRSGPDRSKKKT